MSTNIKRLVEIMALLRDPDKGCPWDVEQTFATIVPHTIEEAYEVADAIERDDMAGLVDELGDLLLQVVFHARMADEAGHFDFDDVAGAICDKLVRRHPHVFGDAKVDGAADQTRRHGPLHRPLVVGHGVSGSSTASQARGPSGRSASSRRIGRCDT